MKISTVLHFSKSRWFCEDCGKPLEELHGGVVVCRPCGVAYDSIFFRVEGGSDV